MHKLTSNALAIFVNFAFTANQLLAQLPPETFEATVWVPYQAVGNGAQPGWQLFSGNAITSPMGEGYGGGRAMKIPVGPGESRISRSLEWNLAEQTAFIDFRLKPAAEPLGSAATFHVNGSQIAFQVAEGSSTGEIWVLHGHDGFGSEPSEWIKTVGTFTVPPGGTAASNYLRVTLRHNYGQNIWDLFIDQKLAAANLGFNGKSLNLGSIDFYGSEVGATWIDDLSADPVNMLFQQPDSDTNKNGISDLWERANNGGQLIADRNAIKLGTSSSFLDLYMASLWTLSGVNGRSGLPASGIIPALTIDADAPHIPVGALKGSLSIGGDGSANYSVPIEIPKGTGGMEPKLSLGYSSNSGNGNIGVGWNLAGLQRISRGPATAAKDGEYDPVDFDSKDRFFLDGERLVCVSGTYGQAGSEYRTEIDSFARITAVGTGPASWKVETKAGLIVTLGGTPESKTAVAAGTLAWGVSEVADTVGNYYSVSYTRSDPLGDYDFVDHRVSKIDYTGNHAENTAPYCSVVFSYEDRTDISESFTALAGYKSTMRLAKICVLTGNYVNHSYRLTYKNSYQSGRSFLKSVTKCMRDDNSLSVPPTTFNYDGLVEPANSTTNPLWNDAEMTNLPVYGSGLDATGEVNSMVTVDALKTTIQLTGDVARAYRLPGGGVTLQQNTRIKFEIKSARLNSGALIGLDSDTNYQSAASTALYRICETGKTSGTVKMASGMNFAGVTKTYDPSAGWTTFTLNIGADQPNTGLRKYLVLMLVDNNISDSVDSVEFRNIRIYNGDTPDPTSIAPLQFDAPDQLPRYADANGADLGVVALDLDSDGLTDLADWRAISYPRGSGNVLGPTTFGNTYRNTGLRSFVRDSTIRPPTFLPLTVRSSDAVASEYDRRHHLVAQPVDIDGDGSLDLMAADNIISPYGSIKNGFKFYSFINGGWTVKTGWDLPFLIANKYAASDYGGYYRDEHFQWLDLNSDGYQDLIVHTANLGQLFSTSGTLILDSNKGTAYLNKGTAGPGWILAPQYRLPEILLNQRKDLGRRVVDLNGDGISEIAEASDIGGAPVRHTYQLGSGSGYLWNSTPGLADPPSSPYDLPASLVTGDQQSEGVVLADLNADGMIDIYKYNGNSTSQVWMNRGSKGSTAWVREPSLGTAGTSQSSYSMPSPLHFPRNGGMVPYGFEQADLNGDGLTDILYSDDESSSRPGPDNFALLNTGNGWLERGNWGLPGNYRIFTSTDSREKGKRRAKLQDINGDGFPDLITGVIDQTPRIWLNNCRPEVLQTVTDGFGSQLTVAYRRLNDPSPINGFNSRVYEKLTGPLEGNQAAIIDSRLVVSRYSEPNGKGGFRYRSQRYGDLRYDRKNESSLGFGWIEAMDELNRQISRVEYSRVFPFGGSPLKTTSSVEVAAADRNDALPGVGVGVKVLSEETATYKQMPYTVGVGGVVRRPVQTQSVKTLRDLTGTIVSQTTTTQNLADFDDYGFVKESTVDALDGTRILTKNDYLHNVTQWYLGRLDNSTVVKTRSGKAEINKKSQFSYDTHGLLASETIEPDGDASQKSIKSYQRDGFGNITSTSLTGSGITRSSSSHYDSKGRFLLKRGQS